MGSLYRPKYRDDKGASVSKKGLRYTVCDTYWMKYRTNGRLVRESTATTKLNEAKKILARRMGAAAEGRPILP